MFQNYLYYITYENHCIIEDKRIQINIHKYV